MRVRRCHGGRGWMHESRPSRAHGRDRSSASSCELGQQRTRQWCRVQHDWQSARTERPGGEEERGSREEARAAVGRRRSARTSRNERAKKLSGEAEAHIGTRRSWPVRGLTVDFLRSLSRRTVRPPWLPRTPDAEIAPKPATAGVRVPEDCPRYRVRRRIYSLVSASACMSERGSSCQLLSATRHDRGEALG